MKIYLKLNDHGLFGWLLAVVLSVGVLLVAGYPCLASAPAHSRMALRGAGKTHVRSLSAPIRSGSKNKLPGPSRTARIAGALEIDSLRGSLNLAPALTSSELVASERTYRSVTRPGHRAPLAPAFILTPLRC